jgi:hypothetical protein
LVHGVAFRFVGLGLVVERTRQPLVGMTWTSDSKSGIPTMKSTCT